MKSVRYIVATCSVLCLAGWGWLHKPYSPTDDLPNVAYSAYEVATPSEEAGNALANAVMTWNGVTASTFNQQSGLIVVSHYLTLDAETIRRQIQNLSSCPVTLKEFPELPGPKCPVPARALIMLPGWLLSGAIGFGICFLLISFFDKRPRLNRLSSELH